MRQLHDWYHETSLDCFCAMQHHGSCLLYLSSKKIDSARYPAGFFFAVLPSPPARLPRLVLPPRSAHRFHPFFTRLNIVSQREK
jgi:hypothetical protein